MKLSQLLFEFIKNCPYISLGADNVVMPCHIPNFTDILFFYPKAYQTTANLQKTFKATTGAE